MGRQEDAYYIGAIAMGSMIFNFIYWSFGFLRMGTTGLTAQAFGRKDAPEIMTILGRSLVLAFAGSLLVLALQIPLEKVSLWLVEGTPEVKAVASEYFYIRIWAAPATLGLYAFMGWFFGMQNAIYPLILTIVINVVNIVLNFAFVYGLGMQADGVALGTVFAQYAGILVALFLFWYKYREYYKHLEMRAVKNVEAMKNFMKLNGDIFIRTFALIFVLGFFTSKSAGQGDVIFAVNAVLLQCINWISYGVDGFAYAAESLVGKFKGAKERILLNKSIRLNFVWGMLLAGVFVAIFGIFGEPIIKIFTDQEAVLAAASPFIFWLLIYAIVGTPSFIWDGVFIGLTASKAMRDTMLLSLAAFLAAFYIFTPSMGNHGMWLALIVFLFSRGLLQTIWYYRLKMDRVE